MSPKKGLFGAKTPLLIVGNKFESFTESQLKVVDRELKRITERYKKTFIIKTIICSAKNGELVNEVF